MYSLDEEGIIWLDNFDFISYRKKEKILNIFDNAGDVLDCAKINGKKHLLNNILSNEEISLFLNETHLKKFQEVLKVLEKLNLRAVTILSNDYPEFLRQIDTPPFVLYCRGNIDLLKEEGFAVVGTRHITNYGRQVTEKFTRELVEAGLTIVSGLAGGVDMVAHSTTLLNNGKTIAVLAGGLDEIYPKTNTNLANEIVAKGGLLITETRPYKRTEAYMFPIRNRIIAGLSKGVLITEAQEISGVIHTKNYALDFGKEVFSVPGSIFSLTSVGTNKMIINGQAKAVMCIQDILDEYHIILKEKKKENNFVNFSMEECLILEELKKSEKSFQELIDITKFETKTLNSLLTTLLIRGIIKKLAGNVYYLV